MVHTPFNVLCTFYVFSKCLFVVKEKIHTIPSKRTEIYMKKKTIYIVPTTSKKNTRYYVIFPSHSYFNILHVLLFIPEITVYKIIY